MTDSLNYSLLIDQAMRGMVRDLLKRITVSGLPNDHHFYISFATTHPGVRMSEGLRAKYPKDITIVMQHQFWDFKVEEHQFHVTLSFGGMPEKLVIPFAALTAFADPSVKFGLQFQNSDGDAPAMTAEEVQPSMSFEDADGDAAENGKAEIISIDAFRKK